MTRPQIAQADDQIGFHWVTVDGSPIELTELVRTDLEPERLVPTHLEALDDALIDAARRWGEFLGGGRSVASGDERRDLVELARTLDRLNHEYASAAEWVGLPVPVRAGQIIGTSVLIAILARVAVGIAGPTPFDGELDDPRLGVLAGRGQFQLVDAGQPWRGGRWVLQAEDGRRYPLTLATILFDSSGVNRDGALDEHRIALDALTAAASADGVEDVVFAGALDWLLYDWLMAHRESPESGAIEIRKDSAPDALMIVRAADAAANARARLDPSLFAAQRETGSV